MERFEGLVGDASAWTGADLQRDQSWIIEVTPDQAREIRAAVDAVRQMPIDKISRDMFRLPAWKATCDHIDRELEGGRGFVLMRGMPLDGLEMDDIKRLYWGFGIQLGEPVSQNKFGNLICHVRNEGARYGTQNSRGYNSNMALKVHNDSTDVVGLLCLANARRGGDSLLVSSTTIFNEMRRRRPELLERLFEPLATDRRGETPAGMKPFFEIPVFSWHAGFLTAIYQRQYIDSAQRFPDAPRLEPAHLEALDLFDALAEDPKLNFRMRLEPGDVQFVHNHTLLHDRTAFVDWPEPERRRHLLRLWLAVPDARPLPEVFAQRYGSVTVGDRGGIVVPGRVPCVPEV